MDVPDPPDRPDPETVRRGRGRLRAWIVMVLAAAFVALGLSGLVLAIRRVDSDRASSTPTAVAPTSPPASSAPSLPGADLEPDYVFAEKHTTLTGLAVYRITPDLIGDLSGCRVHLFRGREAYVTECAHASRLALFYVGVFNAGERGRFPLARFRYIDDRGRELPPIAATRRLTRRGAFPTVARIRHAQWRTGWIAFRVDDDTAASGLAYEGPQGVSIRFRGHRSVART